MDKISLKPFAHKRGAFLIKNTKKLDSFFLVEVWGCGVGLFHAHDALWAVILAAKNVCSVVVFRKSGDFFGLCSEKVMSFLDYIPKKFAYIKEKYYLCSKIDAYVYKRIAIRYSRALL